jgi:DDE superfamily endonuclease/Transposase
LTAIFLTFHVRMTNNKQKRAENFTKREISAISNMRNDGMTFVQIAKIFSVSESAVRMSFNRNAIVEGLPAKEIVVQRAISPYAGKLLIDAIKTTPSISLNSLQTMLKKSFPKGKIPSRETIKQYLNEKNIFQRKMKKKPLISLKNQEKRVEFAQKLLQKQFDFDCDDIVFSDETTVRQYNCSSVQTYWHQNDENFIAPTMPNVHSGGQSVMFWGCMSNAGFGPIVPVTGTMNAEKYCELLENVVSPYIQTLEQSGRRVVFQQDNAPCHSAKRVQAKLRELKINTFKWPAVSPDLNPIENVWATLKKRRNEKYGIPKNKNRIIEEITTTWNSFSIEEAQKYSGSFEKRLQLVEKSNGLPIDY